MRHWIYSQRFVFQKYTLSLLLQKNLNTNLKNISGTLKCGVNGEFIYNINDTKCNPNKGLHQGSDITRNNNIEGYTVFILILLLISAISISFIIVICVIATKNGQKYRFPNSQVIERSALNVSIKGSGNVLPVGAASNVNNKGSKNNHDDNSSVTKPQVLVASLVNRRFEAIGRNITACISCDGRNKNVAWLTKMRYSVSLKSVDMEKGIKINDTDTNNQTK